MGFENHFPIPPFLKMFWQRANEKGHDSQHKTKRKGKVFSNYQKTAAEAAGIFSAL